MTPTVDWIRFLVLMDGQCEPGLSEYEVSESMARLAHPGEEAWDEMTAIERADWRVIQQESQLALPCHPSDVKRWADSQFLDISQELQYAINDEEIERIRLSEPEPSGAPGRIDSSEVARARADKRWAKLNSAKTEIEREALPMIVRGQMNHAQIAAELREREEFKACSPAQIRNAVKTACREAGREDLILGIKPT
ncbi:hypothetical protein [Thiocapsa bogorovii]|uniref:hypothetical protein n=1 Tax=Thiocapsa bogorovii TaxID=521689 RepID=UPI001E5F8096|nr:hypothetical protein [Thiocapsa bogorovii]UHD17379.1 hypothetical protein LT988_04840 [Thiocapsa bogorovii]